MKIEERRMTPRTYPCPSKEGMRELPVKFMEERASLSAFKEELDDG